MSKYGVSLYSAKKTASNWDERKVYILKTSGGTPAVKTKSGRSMKKNRAERALLEGHAGVVGTRKPIVDHRVIQSCGLREGRVSGSTTNLGQRVSDSCYKQYKVRGPQKMHSCERGLPPGGEGAWKLGRDKE